MTAAPSRDFSLQANSPRSLAYKLLVCVLVSIMWQAAQADAVDAPASMFSFNGFGTAGVVHSSEAQADFTSSSIKPNGAGYSHNWSVDVDSRIGAQLTADITPQLSAVVQVIAEQGYDNTYKPNVEWANVKYQFTSDFGVRLGRIELPTFLVSDFRKVGYANPWVRPPIEVYGVAPLTNNDGVDVSYRLHFGDVTNTLRGAYGNSYKLNLPSIVVNTHNLWGIFDTAEYAAVVFHASYLQAKTTVDPPTPLFGAFRQFGPAGIAIADANELSNKSVSIVTFGASYDPGGWFAMSEWTRISSHSFLGVNTAWYVSGGYRIGKFTPYITTSQITASRVSDSGLAAADFPSEFAGTIAALDAGLDAILASTSHIQRSDSVGGRWDVAKNIDLKLQYDRTRIGADSTGTLINIQPGFKQDDTVNIFSATVDFVF
jgi:opacity protein-like surface antigen